MKKTLLFISLVFVVLFSYAQKQETVLFAYNSSIDDFGKIMIYCEELNVIVIEYCEDEKLVYINLNNQYTEYSEFFMEVEKVVDGKCSFVADSDEMLRYLNCMGREEHEFRSNENTKKERQ